MCGKLSKQGGPDAVHQDERDESDRSIARRFPDNTRHDGELDKELSSSVFHADKFPTATFAASKIVKTGENTGSVTGDLTMAGVTRPVTLNVTFNGGRNFPLPFYPYRLRFYPHTIIQRPALRPTQ